MFLARVFRISLWSSFLANSYAILMRPIKAETAVHGCHFPGVAVRMCKLLAKSWVGARVCHLLLLLFLNSGWDRDFEWKKGGMGGINKNIWAGNHDLSTFCEPSKILISARTNTKNYFSWELENINFIVQRKLLKHMKNFIISLISRLLVVTKTYGVTWNILV